MTEPTVVHDTFTLERTYGVAPERVFAFLAEPEKKRRWYAAGEERDIEGFEMDFRPGGVERSSSRMGDKTPIPGVVLANEGRFEDIVENRRVVISTSMTLGGRRISTSLVTFEVISKDRGADLLLTHQACFYEGADGPQMRKGGWEALLDRLGQAIEA